MNDGGEDKRISIQEWDILACVAMNGSWPGGREFADQFISGFDFDEGSRLNASLRASISRSLCRLIRRGFLTDTAGEIRLTETGRESIAQYIEKYPGPYCVPRGWTPRIG